MSELPAPDFGPPLSQETAVARAAAGAALEYAAH
jgi:hypothetical protein